VTRHNRRERRSLRALRQIRLNLHWHGAGGVVMTSREPETYAVEVYNTPRGRGRRGLRTGKTTPGGR